MKYLWPNNIGKTLKNLVWNQKAEAFDILYVA